MTQSLSEPAIMLLLPAGRRSDVTEFPVTVADAGPMVRATLLLPEQAARSDHREGWEYFLARLGQFLAAAPSE